MKINPAILRESLKVTDRPLIIFDFEKIEENLRSFRKITKEVGATWSYAIKSHSHEDMIDLTKHFVDGFDISNRNEWEKIEQFVLPEHTIWLTNAMLAKEIEFFKSKSKSCRFIYNVSDLYDLDKVTSQGIDYVIRISSSELFGQKGLSRFGLKLSDVISLKERLLNDHHFKGFHVHQGLEENTKEISREIIKSIKKEFKAFAGQGYIFNLGGSLHHFSAEELHDLLSELKDHFHVHIEPGRALVKGAGHAIAPIEKYILEDHQLRIYSSLSFLAHLKWSRPVLVGILNDSLKLDKFSPKEIVLEGPTCYEFDRSQPFQSHGDVSLSIGSHILLCDISGYSSEWNISFNGIPKAEIKFLGRKLRNNP
jgi:diaminopimelate decarboxylase